MEASLSAAWASMLPLVSTSLLRTIATDSFGQEFHYHPIKKLLWRLALQWNLGSTDGLGCVFLESTVEAYKDFEAFTDLNELLGSIARVR
ncbi:hypothetical protein CCR75_006941 [Bremia lactucae]|uniref:Rab3 GTPase-activating protein catalytic subunit n=1 Tax=Bremia lactucae TaxID=4779 RepID=A0A976IGF3_BRELC|nr:hypothetical protein CCR75_006941 [Bremia lactucae]